MRAAIEQANSTSGADAIHFDLGTIPPHTLTPGSPLPPVTERVTLDGTTDPAFLSIPVIVLDGSSAGASADGLVLAPGSNNSTVKGFVLRDWSGSGLVLASDGATVVNNFAGTDWMCSSAAPNSNGIMISGSSNVVGGADFSVANRFSGNSNAGIYISGGSSNTVRFNLIGTNIDGTAAIANGTYGVFVVGSSGDVIGDFSKPNIISGNSGSAIGISGGTGTLVKSNFIGLDPSGSIVIPNGQGITISDSTGVVIGGTTSGMGNVISGNLSTGVTITGGSANKVQFNTIGTDALGSTAMANRSHGIYVEDSPANVIGPAATAGGNLVSGNWGTGIYVKGAVSTGNTIGGNTVGVDQPGTTKIPNGEYGILLEDISGALIGGTVSSEDNVVGGNVLDGVAIIRGSGNFLWMNEIGVDGFGVDPVGNGGHGVYVEDSWNNEIHGNLVGDNGEHGIFIAGGGGHQLQRNIVGANVTGVAAIPNTGSGIVLENSPDNTIGLPVAGEGNIVSGNSGHGIFITGAGSTGNVIRNTIIGLNLSASGPLGNGGSGVFIDDADGNTVGGRALDLSDTCRIAWNGGDGVTVVDGTGNGIHKNMIHSNGRLGIDLDGEWVTYNDTLDGDGGGNTRLNHPVVTSHTRTSMQGTLHSSPGAAFTIDVYASARCGVSGDGEGARWIGATTVDTNLLGDGSFSTAFSSIGATEVVTALASDGNGNTSEFSPCPGSSAAPETLALFNGDLNLASLISSLQDWPPAGAYDSYDPGTNEEGQWVMGDWDGDGQKTPGVYAPSGVFTFTNDLGTTALWEARWIGITGSAVAGRMDSRSIRDCFGVVERQGVSPSDNYALHFTCNLDGPVAPGVQGQWLGRPLPDAAGFSGEQQYAMGDFNNNGLESLAVRRGPHITFTSVEPGRTAIDPWDYGTFEKAQYFGNPGGAEYGILVAGDWNDGTVEAQAPYVEGRSSFGLFYDDGTLYYRNDLLWYGPQYYVQHVGQPIGAAPIHPVSWKDTGYE